MYALHEKTRNLSLKPLQMEKVLTKDEIFAIIDHLGSDLSTKINKRSSAVKGLLLLAIHDALHIKSLHGKTGLDMEHVLARSLKPLLERFNIFNAKAITDQLAIRLHNYEVSESPILIPDYIKNVLFQ